jgi:homoserine acetyltransferase
MAWTVILEDENGKQIEKLPQEFMTPYFDDSSISAFKILKYLDPYGDTIINSIQANDFVSDLIQLKKIDQSNYSIDDVIAILKKCISSPHTYVVFYGD